jgi:hypothetical protein
VELQPLLEEVRIFDYERSLLLLSEHAVSVPSRPLLTELLQEVGSAPIKDVNARLGPWLRELALAVGARTKYAQTIIISQNRMLHIWPDGLNCESTLLPVSARVNVGPTLCGRAGPQLGKRGRWRRVPRGSWQESAQFANSPDVLSAVRLCRVCAAHAQDYFECAEAKAFAAFVPETQQRLAAAAEQEFGQILLEQLQSGVGKEVSFKRKDGSAEEITRAYLYGLASQALRLHAQRALMEVVIINKERALARIIRKENVERVSTPAPADEIWERVIAKQLDAIFAADADGRVARSYDHHEMRRAVIADLGVDGRIRF